MTPYLIETTKPRADYELIDSGDNAKLERYGSVIISRPDPQALWPKRLGEAEWNKANAYFSAQGGSASGGKRASENAEWSVRGKVPERWPVEFGELKFWIKLSPFKHTGIFPEQESNWRWIRQEIKKTRNQEIKPVKVLNLFGYTGGASLAAAQAGAEVVHVDGSKVAIGWGRDNAELSGLSDKPIRWILDDAFAFVKREVRRGNKYDGIIMDPPAFGHGAKGETWRIEDNFLPLLEACRQILSEKPLFFLMNGYAAGYSALGYRNNLDVLVEKYGGKTEMGELTIEEANGGRLLPAGIFARWSSNPL